MSCQHLWLISGWVKQSGQSAGGSCSESECFLQFVKLLAVQCRKRYFAQLDLWSGLSRDTLIPHWSHTDPTLKWLYQGEGFSLKCVVWSGFIHVWVLWCSGGLEWSCLHVLSTKTDLLCSRCSSCQCTGVSCPCLMPSPPVSPYSLSGLTLMGLINKACNKLNLHGWNKFKQSREKENKKP